MADGKFSKELDVAVRVVHLACSLCQKVQNTLLSTTHQQVEFKDDDSLVTVAGNSFHSLSIFPFFLILFPILVYFYGSASQNSMLSSHSSFLDCLLVVDYEIACLVEVYVKNH